MSKTLSCSLAAIFALSIAVISPKVGPFGVDTVSAATNWVAPAPVKKPVKKPVKSTTPVKYVAATSVTRLLRFNSMGSEVKLLQTTINTKGYKLVVDGIFGKLTLAAVRNYQSINGLAVDGLVGPLTLAKLNAKPVTPVKPPVVKPPVVKPPVVVPPVDVVTAASLVSDAAVFEKSIGKDGKWIITTTKDLTTTKELILDGEFKNGKKDAVTGAELIQRKIGLYTQDDKRVVTARFTLTAPKLTIKSPKASLEYGTFKGNLYVNSADFKLIDATVVGDVYVSATNVTLSKNAKIQGNVYFSTQGAKDTFKLTDASAVTGTQDLIRVDAVTTASVVKDAVAFEKAISKDGVWIPCLLNDLTINKDLVLDGDFKNGKKDPVTGADLIQRKIALYTQASQDGKNVVTARFTLTAPKLTIKSQQARIQGGTFKGDVYVTSANFLLTDAKIVGNVYVSATGFNLTTNAKVDGNVYFATPEAKATFKMDATSSVTEKQELILVDTVSTASVLNNATDVANAMGTKGQWIIATGKDLTTDKDLILEGAYYNGKKDAVTGVGLIQRKIALYTQDEKRVVTARFNLTAPKLTVTSPNARIQSGTFKGDVYVSAKNFELIDAKVDGNVYFTTQAAKDTFKPDAKSSITGLQELKLN